MYGLILLIFWNIFAIKQWFRIYKKKPEFLGCHQCFISLIAFYRNSSYIIDVFNNNNRLTTPKLTNYTQLQKKKKQTRNNNTQIQIIPKPNNSNIKSDYISFNINSSISFKAKNQKKSHWPPHHIIVYMLFNIRNGNKISRGYYRK